MIPKIALPLLHLGGQAPLASDVFAKTQAFHKKQDLSPMYRPIPSTETNSDSNLGLDAFASEGHGRIQQADWDELFKSIQVRLEDCVGDAMLKITDQQLTDRRVLTKTIVLECVQAMKQLQTALNAERSEQQAKQELRSGSPV